MAIETSTRPDPRWRWAVPLAVVAAAALVIGVRPIVADASPTLPPRTAAQLLASLPEAAAQPFSGTVETTARLGLPDLPSSVQGQHAPLSVTSLLAGTHTLRVWYAGPDRQRVALVSDLAEADVIHDGNDAWAWSSDSRGGVHVTLPDHAPNGATRPDPALPGELMRDLTPQRLAEQLLAAVEPSTKVTVDGTATVAGQAAYELVVAPRDQRSLIAQIRLAVDARTSLPLRLQVIGTRSSDPAIESGFTSISYATPSDGVFRAPDVPLRELTVPRHTGPPAIPSRPAPSAMPRVHGSAWTSVLELPRMPDLAALAGGRGVLQPRRQGNGDTDGQGRPNVPPPDDTIVPAEPLTSSPPDGPTDSQPGSGRPADAGAPAIRHAGLGCVRLRKAAAYDARLGADARRRARLRRCGHPGDAGAGRDEQLVSSAALR